MNTTTMLYVGIDVSKDNSDICIKNQAGNDLIQRFTSRPNDLWYKSKKVEFVHSDDFVFRRIG